MPPRPVDGRQLPLARTLARQLHRRPKVDYESRTLRLDRNELGAFLVQAGLGSPRDHALASLLALNGLRISEALGADIDDLEYERGHRTLKILRKGGKRGWSGRRPAQGRCRPPSAPSRPPSSRSAVRRPLGRGDVGERILCPALPSPSITGSMR